MEKEIKIAIIGASAIILAAIIGGLFNSQQSIYQPPVLKSFEPDKASSQFIETKVNWTANAEDSKKNIILYNFLLKGPSTNNTWEVVQDWSTQNWWSWIPKEPGEYDIEVRASNSKNFDTKIYDSRDVHYSIIGFSEPVDAEDWYQEGKALENLGRNEEALAAFNEAIELDKNNSEYWNEKGTTLYILGRFSEAYECDCNVTELAPSRVCGWFNKGAALEKLGRFNESIEAMNEALKINQAANSWAGKGLALKDLNRYNESLECCDKAIELDPLFANGYEFKSETLFCMGRYNESIECSENAIKLDPSNGLALANEAVCFYAIGNYSEAIKLYDKALVIDPSNLDWVNAREQVRKTINEQNKLQNNSS